MIARTDRLFALPTFVGGLARTLDIGATYSKYNVSRSAAEADAKALASDWGVAVGDFRQVAETVAAQAERKRAG